MTSGGVTVKRTLTDCSHQTSGNAKNCTCRSFREVAHAHGVRLKLTRPYRPQANGEAERFNRTLQAVWVYSSHSRQTACGCERCLVSSATTIITDRMVASAGQYPPQDCKQRPAGNTTSR
ncbi:MAG: transposase family protein [Chloroflexi bacterium]|nr:transposase family protein [Chloroflexota bacterium]